MMYRQIHHIAGGVDQRIDQRKRNYIIPGFSEKHDEHRLKPHKMDIPRHNYLF